MNAAMAMESNALEKKSPASIAIIKIKMMLLLRECCNFLSIHL